MSPVLNAAAPSDVSRPLGGLPDWGWSYINTQFDLLLCILFGSLADFDTLLGGEVGGVECGKLPFGACEEPIR